MKVALSRSAAHELADAADWYEVRTEGQGVRFAEAVDAVLASLLRVKRRPLRGFDELGVYVVSFPKRWPYRIFFVERAEQITVIAIAHNRRAPGYWLAGMEGR